MSYTSEEAYLIDSSSAKDDYQAVVDISNDLRQFVSDGDNKHLFSAALSGWTLNSSYAKDALNDTLVALNSCDEEDREALRDDTWGPIVSDIEEALDMGSNENDEHRTYI